jgi:hypothetical protein
MLEKGGAFRLSSLIPTTQDREGMPVLVFN